MDEDIVPGEETFGEPTTPPPDDFAPPVWGDFEAPAETTNEQPTEPDQAETPPPDVPEPAVTQPPEANAPEPEATSPPPDAPELAESAPETLAPVSLPETPPETPAPEDVPEASGSTPGPVAETPEAPATPFAEKWQEFLDMEVAARKEDGLEGTEPWKEIEKAGKSWMEKNFGWQDSIALKEDQTGVDDKIDRAMQNYYAMGRDD